MYNFKGYKWTNKLVNDKLGNAQTHQQINNNNSNNNKNNNNNK